MEFLKKIGYVLSALGMILYLPPVSQQLALRFGQAGYLGGPVLFSVGWGLLAAYLSFHFGRMHQQRRQQETIRATNK